MKSLQTVHAAYSQAWANRITMIAALLSFRLIALGVLVPAVGLLTNLAVSLSSQSALTDQDIAEFLLTPVGGAAIIAVLSVVSLVFVFEFTLITLVIHNDLPGIWNALQTSVMILIERLRPLFIFALHFVVRVTVIAGPFVVAGLLIAQHYLTQFDINYYLSARPPEFLMAVGLIGILIILLATILLGRLLSWAVSLHLILFDESSPKKAFADSAQRMKSHRLSLLKQVFIWLAIRLAIGSAIALIAGLIIKFEAADTGSMRAVLVFILITLAVWAVADLVIASISDGALAYLLYQRFDPNREHVKIRAKDKLQALSVRWVIAGILVAGGIGLVAGTALLDRVQTKDNVQIIAHRGAAGDRPENTMASVRKAIEDGADWIEIDVQETADNEVVVVHDSDFMKLARVDLKIWDATMEDLAEIDIGSWFDPQFADERTPLLRDVLLEARGRAKVLIELKYYGHDVDLENRVIDIVETTDMAQNIATMSLKFPAVEKMKTLRPDWSSGVLAATAIGNLARLNADFVAVSGAILSQSLIDNVHKEGKDIYVWTINDPLGMSNMISRGVDGIITDEPALARRVLEVRADLGTAERLLLSLAGTFGVKLNTEQYRDESP